MYCRCRAGNFGELCDEGPDICAVANPCYNGATCNSDGTCDCSPGTCQLHFIHLMRHCGHFRRFNKHFDSVGRLTLYGLVRTCLQNGVPFLTSYTILMCPFSTSATILLYNVYLFSTCYYINGSIFLKCIKMVNISNSRFLGPKLYHFGVIFQNIY